MQIIYKKKYGHLLTPLMIGDQHILT